MHVVNHRSATGMHEDRKQPSNEWNTQLDIHGVSIGFL
ncbi:hypothetical protein PLUTE_b0530 [Pseudoalteromonas luteoviolacea DSM 6061]|nr:hypothetical protein [Pseudoalteromonas luteoviolacea DSM 6061]